MRKPKENTNCPYCLSPIADEEDKVRCPKCGVTHHVDCWKANGKCSVYGCEGWALWSDGITDKLAPKTPGSVEVSGAEAEKPKARETMLCIKCGQPVKPGRMLCWDCLRKKRPHYFENCFGPSVLLLGGAIGIITLIVKALT